MDDSLYPHFRPIYAARRFGFVGVVACTLILATGAAVRAANPGAKLIVQPEKIALDGSADEHGLLVTLVDADGRTVDVTTKCHFTSESPKIASVSAEAVCKPVADGHADIAIEYDGLTAKAGVDVSDAAKALPSSFRQDVLPVLTKAGCNAGSCHGKLAGQNGFRLSLRGYAPEWDYDSLTSELGSRRIDFAAPDKSLLLRKPTGQVPHEGGRRFVEGSRYYKAVLQWIENRSPGPDAAELDAATLDVLPGSRLMYVGDTQQLLVIARWPDGKTRDVTWLSQFYSNDTSVLSVGESGLVKSIRGATTVRVHFQGLVSVVSFTTPFDNQVDASAFAQKNNDIDRDVFGMLESLHLPPSPLCDDATFIRRAFIDTIGTVPSPKEVRDFLADTGGDKRAKLVDALSERPEYAEYWALMFADLLENRRERDHDVRGVKGVRAMHEWLHGQMAKNRPWNELTRDLLTGTGDAVHNPQIGYFIVLLGENQRVEESDVTDSVAQAFLGTRMGCARCHNHPFERYTQDDYYHFAAFFSRTSLRRGDLAKGTTTSLMPYSRDVDQVQKQIDDQTKKITETAAQLVVATPGDVKKLQVNMTALVKREEELTKERARTEDRPAQVTQPRTGKPMAPQPIDRSPTVVSPGQDPRQELADWITNPKNDYFSGAMVNRLWKHFMGLGLVEPVDDLRASNPPSNPALMKLLESEFVSHNFDLKHVMRLILNSRTYQLSSTTLAENVKDPHFFSHFYARRLESEVMADAVSDVTGVPAAFPGYPTGLRAIQLPDPTVNSYFLTLFGRSERVTACACERSQEVNLSQLLHLNNGDDVQDKIASPDGRLAKLLAAKKDDTETTNEVFLAAFGRLPNDAERAAVEKTLAAGDPREDVYRDLMWALLNSKEFAFNH